MIFGIHLILLGYLIYRSEYIPRSGICCDQWVGLVIDRVCSRFIRTRILTVFVTFFGEFILMLYVDQGWKIKDPRSEGALVSPSATQLS